MNLIVKIIISIVVGFILYLITMVGLLIYASVNDDHGYSLTFSVDAEELANDVVNEGRLKGNNYDFLLNKKISDLIFLEKYQNKENKLSEYKVSPSTEEGRECTEKCTSFIVDFHPYPKEAKVCMNIVENLFIDIENNKERQDALKFDNAPNISNIAMSSDNSKHYTSERKDFENICKSSNYWIRFVATPIK